MPDFVSNINQVSEHPVCPVGDPTHRIKFNGGNPVCLDKNRRIVHPAVFRDDSLNVREEQQ